MNNRDGLARAAAVALVSAMTGDLSESVKRSLAAVIRHQRQMDDTRAALAGRSGDDLAQLRSLEVQAWTTRLRDILLEDPGAAVILEALARDPRSVIPGPVTVLASQDPAGDGTAVTVGTGRDTYTRNRTVRIDNRQYHKRFTLSLSPLSLLRHAFHHPVASLVTIVLVGGASAGLVLHPQSKGHPAGPAPVSTTTPPSRPVPVPDLDWADVDQGPGRTGYQPDETAIGTGNVSTLTLTRTYRTGGESLAPLVANGILYVDTGTLYAFDATGATGCSGQPKACTPLWTAPTAFPDGMTIGDGDVFVTDDEGVQAFSASGSAGCSGAPKVCTPLWTTSTHGLSFKPGTGSPLVAGGVLYVPGYGDGMPVSAGGALVAAFDPAGKSGCSGTPAVCTPMWTTTGLPTSIANSGSPAVANGVLYIASGSLDAFDAAGSAGCTGTPKVCGPLWTAAISGPASSAPAVANGTIYVNASGAGLYAFSAAGTNCSTGVTPRTCSPLWTTAAISAAGGPLAVARGVVYAMSEGGTLSAFDAAGAKNCQESATGKTCSPLWAYAAGAAGNLTSAPAVANGVVYFSADDGGIYAFDAAGSARCSVSGTAKTCAPLWKNITGFTSGSPAVVGGVVYMNAVSDGTVYAYALPPS
jgi:hypothetical protein